jgi:hypothetical protein
MLTPEIEEFAKLLVQQGRDEAIKNCDTQLRGDANSPVARRWRNAQNSGGQRICEVMIADCVDKAVSSLLRAIDQGDLLISFTASNGKTMSLSDAGMGELCGWYNGSGGWRAMYSKERFVDDYSDLK